MRLIKWWLLTLSAVTGLAQAVDLPGPVVSADWLSKNLANVQVVEVRSDVATYARQPEFEVDKKLVRKC